MGGQRVEETIGGTLKIAKFDGTVKSAKDISIEGAGSEKLTVR